MRLKIKSRRETGMDEHMRVMEELSQRRDRILESPALDVEALAELVSNYEEAGLICGAAGLRRRVEWYRSE